MPSVETILEEEALPGDVIHVPAPGLRHGDIESGTGVTTVGGVPQPAVTYAVDYAGEAIEVRNDGAAPWAAGAKLVVTWTGLSLEATVQDHEVRIETLEAGGGTGGGGGGSDVGLTERVDVLETKVETHEWQLQGHEARISADHTALVTLDGEVGAHNTHLAALDTRVTQTETENAEQDASIGDLDGRVATLEAAPPSGGEGTGGVPSTGGTFTGPVVFKGSDVDSFAVTIDTPIAADGCSILGKSAGVNKWEISLATPNAQADFAISRYPDYAAEFPLDSPLVIQRLDGFIKLKLPECADSAAAGTAGVPIGGLFHTSGAVKIRLY